MDQGQLNYLLHIYSPLAATERGKSSKFHSSSTHLVYSISNVVVVRDLQDLTKTTIFDGHKFETTAAQISPSGNLCCSGDARGNLFIWEIRTQGHPISKQFENQLGGAIKDIAWTSDGQRIVVVGEGKTYFAKALLLDTGSSLGEISGVSKNLYSCDVRPQRPYRLVVGGEEYSLQWYEGPPFKFKRSSKQHTNFVNTIRFNKSGDLFVSGSSDKKLFLYDGKTGEEIKEIVSDHTRSITEISWITDQSFITSSNDTTLKIWTLDGLQKTLKIEGAHEIEDMQVSVQVVNDTAYSIGLSGSLNIFKNISQIQDQSFASDRLYGHISLVNTLAFHQEQLISGDNNGKILFWIKNLAHRLNGPSHTKLIIGLSISSEGDFLYSLGGEQLKISSFNDRTVQKTVDCKGQTLALAASKKFNNIAYVLFENAQILQFTDLEVTKQYDLGYETSTFAVSDKYFFVGDKDGKIHQLDIETGNQIHEYVVQHSRITSITVKGDTFLAGDTTGKMKYFDFETKQLIHGDKWTYHTTIISYLGYSSDGKFAVSASQDNKFMVWNLENGQRIHQMLDAHKRGILTAQINNHNQLITSGGDNVMKLWNLGL
ncbi:hypothetical protein pb186bvf_005741 [Paramecium bursaria]